MKKKASKTKKQSKRILKNIKFVPPEAITPYNKNPRVNDMAVPEVEQSLDEFDFLQPIVVDKKGVIIVGHTRWLAAQELELSEIPVIYATHLKPKQVKAYRLADNKTGEFSIWDTDLIPDELKGLKDIYTGFNDEEYDQIFNDDDMDDLDIIDDFSESVSFPIKCTNIAEKEKVQDLLNTQNDSITFKDFCENFNNRNRR